MTTLCIHNKKKKGSVKGQSTLDIEHGRNCLRFAESNEEVAYYEKTGHLLFHYYELLEKGRNGTDDISKQQHGKDKATNSDQVLLSSYFQINTKQRADAVGDESSSDAPRGGGTRGEGGGGGCAESYVSASKCANMSRQELYSMYVCLLGEENPGYAIDTSNAKNTIPPNISKTPCGHCGFAERTLVPHEGYLTCPSCDTVEYVVIDSDQPNYRDPPREISYFCYKRQNHFQELISQTQGREHTNISDAIYDSITVELKRQKITNVANLTPAKLKEVLKKLNLNKYYEHIPHILNHLSGTQLARIPPDLEQQLRRMFQQIQVPFMKFSPLNRRNFLSYSFVLHKFLQLLGNDELLDHFPLLKSREKLFLQDVTWKAICQELGWQFIPSI